MRNLACMGRASMQRPGNRFSGKASHMNTHFSMARSAWLAACLMVCSSFLNTATAAETNGIYGAIGGGVTFGTEVEDKNFDFVYDEFDAGFWGSIAVGYAFKQSFRLEAELNLSTTEADSGLLANSDLRSGAIMLNAWLDFARDSRVSPYIGGGIGAVSIRDDSDDDLTGFGAQVGAGLRFKLTERFFASLDYRYIIGPSLDDNDTDFEEDFSFQEHRVGIALGMYFSSPNYRADSDNDGVDDQFDRCPRTVLNTPVDNTGCKREQFQPQIKDSDGDGVVDRLDACPATPLGQPVNTDGCELILPPPPVVVPLDSDQDGIPDDGDQCPGTPLGTPVGNIGCPFQPEQVVIPVTIPDNDRDGVEDAYDQCPSTMPGLAVMSNGCAASQSLILRGVNFETGSARLTQDAQYILDQVAETLRSSPGFSVKIIGHTDSNGSDTANYKLSEARANSVVNYLVNRGVDGRRLSSIGYGEWQPIADNATAQGRAENRRVEMEVIDALPRY